jgi:RNA polymerase sigma-70 factor (ECF subfamily)
MSSCDPDRLLLLLRAGDIAALDQLGRCQGERLLAFGRRRCRNPEEAEDAVSEAMLAAGQHLQDFRGEGSPEGWILRMVARACSRFRRGARNDPSRHVPLIDLDLATLSPNPEQAAAQAQIAEALGDALLRLPPADRALLLLSDGEGWKGPELAEKLELSPVAVRSRLSRARARLRKELPSYLSK